MLRYAEAHEGPPFPIIVDAAAPGFTFSVWADPDIGTGTFFVTLSCGTPCDELDAPRVAVSASPKDGVGEEQSSLAGLQERASNFVYYAELPLAHGGMWQIRVQIDGAQGPGHATTEVEATPDGVIGPIGVFLYSLPFVAVGALWVLAAVRRRGYRGNAPPAA